MLITFSSTFAQYLNGVKESNATLHSCGFDHKHDILMQDTSYEKLIQFSEQQVATYLSTPRTRSSNDIYTIPVVVHVLHLGEQLGVGTNISDAQIQSAINNLNDVYRGQTAGSPVDFEIEFALAQQDPNCSAHSGINRINASSVPNYSTGGVDYYGDGGEADETILKDLSRWPEAEYFNIWIVSEIEDNNGGYGIQGYANFFTGSAYEGSMMMATVFGFDPTSAQSSFNLNAPRDNSTVVHEIGHYLHLHHTFKGDGDADNDGIGDACPGDVTIGVDSDGCADTEPHKRYTSQCKSGLLNDCTGATFGDNTAKNFMSYASCQDRLTSGQKTRSRAMLATSGISLIFSKGDESPLSISGTLTNANCTPQSSSTATSGGYGGIMNFTIVNEFSASSSYTQNDGGYVDFTTECLKTISLEEDSTYNFELTTWYNGHDYKGYIDFNNDGDFLDANEEVFSGANPPNVNGTNGTNTSTGNGTLSIPTADGANVLANTPLRLRIISEVNGTITDACYSPFYAQAEDYQLIISQSNISVQKTYVPDDNFEAYLETHDASGNVVVVGASNSMGDGIANNDSVTTANISGVTNLAIQNQNIANIIGLQDFSNLTHLYCGGNQLSILDVSQNTSLTNLGCWQNQLTSLDLSFNPNLSALEVFSNLLSNLDLSQNTALTYLNCGLNQLTNLDISQNIALTAVVVNNNQINSLDVSQNTALTQISCSHNQISSLDLSQNLVLGQLGCADNQLVTLDLSQNTNIWWLGCNDNQLINLNLTQNSALSQLNFKNNQLINLDLRNGNNTIINNFEGSNNPNLNCISVEDPVWSTANWTNIDSHTIFMDDCGGGFEDFTNSNAINSFTDGSFVGNSSITWTYKQSSDGRGDANNSGISLPALTFNYGDPTSPRKITSSIISGGISDFSVKLYKGKQSSGNRQVELFVNGVSKGTSTIFDDYNEHIFTVSGINISGDIVIEISNIYKPIIIDDIS